MAQLLTQGAVQELFHQQREGIPDLHLQVLNVRSVGVPARPGVTPGTERWRMIISDGTHHMTGMLSTQLNHLVGEGGVQKHSILHFSHYGINVVGDRHVVVALSLEVVDGNYPERIGNPVPCDSSGAGVGPPAPVKPEPLKEDAKPVLNAFKSTASSSIKKPSVPARTGGGPSVIPIQGLSPYSNKWKIKARVVQKAEIKHWHNARGEGKLFSVTLSDESGQIRATGFNEAVDQLYDRLVVGEVFYISRAKVTVAKKQFNNLPHDYEIMFENMTEVDECDDAGDIPVIQLTRYMPLSALAEVEKDHVCDIVAILKDAGEAGEIIGKQSQRAMTKRDIVLLDQSAFSTRMTLWGKQAEEFHAPVESILAFQGVKVGDYQGRNLSMVSSSIMAVNPEIAEAYELRGWYDNEGSSVVVQSHSNLSGGGNNAPITQESLKTIGQVNAEGLGKSEKGDYYNLRATVMFIKLETFAYPACPTDRCNKKMVQHSDDEWKCEKCDKTYPAPDYRYLIQFSAADHTGIFWLSGFNEVGQTVVGMSANELTQLQQDDEAGFRRVMQAASHVTYDFVCRAKQEVYADVPRTKHSILRAAPVNYATAGLQIAEMLVKNYGN